MSQYALHPRWMRSRMHAQRGIAAVEFALIFFVLLFGLYGIVTFGVMLYTKQVVSRSAEEGARAALRLGKSVQTNDSRVREAIYDALASALITPTTAGTSIEEKKAWLKRAMTTTPPEITFPSADTVLVKVAYPYAANPIFPPGASWLNGLTNAQLISNATAARPAF